MTTTSPVTATAQHPVATPRILAPDLARGMMLLGIALANVSVYLWGQSSGTYSMHPSGEGPFDTALAALAIVFIDGHIYPMFAFLFGYGITQFAVSRIGRGVPATSVSRMLLRRHVWLLLFGMVHALLLFAGDILGAYALTGLVLTALLLRGSDRVVRLVAWILGGVSAGFILLTAAGMIALGAVIPAEYMEIPPELQEGLPGTADLMSGVEHYGLAMLIRFVIWVVSSGGAVLSLIVPLAVLLGGFAARYRWLEGTATRFSLKRIAMWGITIGIVGSLPAALSHLGIWGMGELVSGGFFLLSQLAGIAGGLGYVALFALIGKNRGATQLEAAEAHPVIWAISAVGKRSLSFYLLQSVIFAPLLSAWGFGLGSQIGTGTAYLIAGAVWLVSVGLAVWLEHAGKRGPAEVLLRKLTYGTYDPAVTNR